jgi:hypothetical protein
MISEWLWIGKDFAGSGRGLILRYYPGIRLVGLRKTTTKEPIRIASRRGRELNPGPPQYEVGVLTTQPRRSVMVPFSLVEVTDDSEARTASI